MLSNFSLFKSISSISIFFIITAKFCHSANMIIINNVFDKIYMLITGGAFAQLWLIIYKNIVSATINLPLFQLAKKKTMSFRIMQNYKNIRNELYCWIVILSNEVVNENRVVYFGNSTKIFIAKNCIHQTQLHRSKLWHFFLFITIFSKM